MATITNTLRYKLVCSGYGERVVTPLGESNFRINYVINDKPNDPRFGYDLTFTGDLVFIGEDFAWLLGAEEGGYRCTDMFLEMESNGCGEGWQEILAGTKVKLSQGQWDLDNCKVTLPVINTDPYECINENKGDQINLFDTTGGAQSVILYDYDPLFEYAVKEVVVEMMEYSDQAFENYPNRRAEYPGFGCDLEIEEPYYPETGTASLELFDLPDLTKLNRNAVTYNEYLSTGSIPAHPDYASPYDAIAVGWRLHYAMYHIFNTTTSGDGMGYRGIWRWVREYKLVATGTPMTDDWIFIETIGGDDKYAKAPSLVPRTRRYEPSRLSASFANLYEVRFFMTNYIVGADTVVLDPNERNTNSGAGDNVYGIKTLNNGRLLNNLIQLAVTNACPDLTVKSEFFQINPTTTTSTNYVTGTTTFVDKIVVFQKSDVKRPFASSAATIGLVTLKELFDWLFYQFKVKYCIFGTTLRIEHVSSTLYRKPAGIDLTAPPFSDMIRGYNRYGYDTGDLAARFVFRFMEARKQLLFSPDDDFAGLPITYGGSCVNREENGSVMEFQLARVTNDVMYILLNGGGASRELIDNETNNKYTVYDEVRTGIISDEGFVFVATKMVGDDRYGVARAGILSDLSIFNNVLGFASLHDAFWRDEANSETGTINGSAVTFDSTRPIKKQVQLPFKMCCITGFDPYEAITSEMGTGIIKAAEWSPFDSVMKVELMYRL